MANYGRTGSITPGPARIGTALAGTFGSLEMSFPATGGIPISPTDYIGIYVEDSTGTLNNPAPLILVEGTIYFSIN